MKVYNEQRSRSLDNELTSRLSEFRRVRKFSAEEYVKAKAVLLNDYLRQFKLGGCVVAVSGGIDSAITLAMCAYAQKLANSPIKTIMPLLVPATKSCGGVTNQEEATIRGRELCAALGQTPLILDISRVHNEAKLLVDQAIGQNGEAWASGQLVPYLRTPILYYAATLLNQSGVPSVIIGTTNKDEGAYLGYFGKASDGMVDVQLISDIHKSEVFSVAQYLGVPASILIVEPNGDMFDGRVDEEVFGASYDFVELYLNYLEFDQLKRSQFIESLSAEAREQFNYFSHNLENLHAYNKHKYLVGSPAVHLDLYENKVPGAWGVSASALLCPAPDRSKFVNAIEFEESSLPTFSKAVVPTSHKLGDLSSDHGIEIKGLLDGSEIAQLLGMVKGKTWVAVGNNGYRSDYNELESKVGSYRLSLYSDLLAKAVWERIKTVVPPFLSLDPSSHPDFDSCPVWKAVGVASLFRFIKYTPGGELVAHYDSPFSLNNHRKTMMSLVVYLTGPGTENGGQTRFVKETRENHNFSDWSRSAKGQEIRFEVNPIAGNALAFQHRLLHDSAPIADGEKIIIRTDIIFERCDKRYG